MKFSGCLSIELCSQLPGVLRNKRRCSQKKRRLLLFPSVLMITCFRSALNDEPEKNAVHYVESSPATFSSAALRPAAASAFASAIACSPSCTARWHSSLAVLTAQLDAHGSLQIEEETPENGGPRRKPRFPRAKALASLQISDALHGRGDARREKGRKRVGRVMERGRGGGNAWGRRTKGSGGRKY